MSWRWSQLLTLAFLAVLYASPLSSGDKGLWLTVTSMPVSLLGAIPGGMPPEHSILLPNRAGTVLARVCVERSESSLGPGQLDADASVIGPTSRTVGDVSAAHALRSACPATTAPRGPPA